METIGFIGVGVMGRGMCLNLLKAGYSLNIFSRTKSSADVVIAAGAHWCASPRELAQSSNIIFTILGYPHDVEEVYLGAEGLIANSRPNSFLVDCTTSTPELAQRIALAASARGLHALDAPVSGGEIGAKNGNLSIMVGGERNDFLTIEPIFKAIGKTIVFQGRSGAGQHTKMANQIVIAGNLCAAVEAIVYAQAQGLDPKIVLESIGAGSAASWQLTNMMPRVLAGDFAPGFYVKHFLKDLRIALEVAHEAGLTLPMLTLAEKMFTILSNHGHADKGTQAIYLAYVENMLKRLE